MRVSAGCLASPRLRAVHLVRMLIVQSSSSGCISSLLASVNAVSYPYREHAEPPQAMPSSGPKEVESLGLAQHEGLRGIWTDIVIMATFPRIEGRMLLVNS